MLKRIIIEKLYHKVAKNLRIIAVSFVCEADQGIVQRFLRSKKSRRVEKRRDRFISLPLLSKPMLTRILDTIEIDMNNPEIRAELGTDLRRMDRLRHEGMPEGSDAYKVKV